LFCGYYLVTIFTNKEACLNDTNPIQEQNSNPRSVAKNSISGDKSPPKQQETTSEENFDKKTIDLNELFPDADTDLNNLFPDDEVKHLLKNIIKNKKDMGLIKERLATENKTPEESKKRENIEDLSEPDNLKKAPQQTRPQTPI
jgi:hypothetical protein